MSDQPPPTGPLSSPPGEPEPPAAGWAGQPPPPGAPPYGPPPPGPAPYGPSAYGPPPGQPPHVGTTPYPGQPAYPGQQPYGRYPHPLGYGLDPADALVTPPGAGLGGWFARCLGAARRGWRELLPILMLTQVVPAAVLSVLVLAVDPSARWDAQLASDSAALPANFWTDLAMLLLVLVTGSLLLGLVQCVGWAAGTWVIARQAAGQPVGLGAALRYGLRRALGLWGWTLLITLIVTFGFCLCFLPGVYAAFALAMAGPVYLFERHDPLSRSHRMLRDRLGLLLGRVALVGAAVIGVSLVASLVESLAILPFGATPLDSPGTAVGVVLTIAVVAVLTLPAYLAQLVGLVVTYAEQRAHEGPVNGAQLAAELG
ncbi:hypothetical protein ACFFMR_10840 [Micromonospora andamanensis]|uniref:Glycerophosphoryl diester phosphodiesterase membrane domain-containing protein n=1 Tax=Micromonospora andamanensis TaxID=1287068 RepID=A0ABQ4HPA5_9ACTN|nr:hypothetical protein [Micromonospora andamanensis]GIJ07478.1 hypothetical protein Van01_06920 [Micromonospora andamanensis]